MRAQVSADEHLTCYRRHQRSGMVAVTFPDRNSLDQSSLHRTNNPRYRDETFRPGWAAGSSPMGPRCDRSERTTFVGALLWSVTCRRETSESTVCSHPGIPGFMGHIRVDLIRGIFPNHVPDGLVSSGMVGNPSIDSEYATVEDDDMLAF